MEKRGVGKLIINKRGMSAVIVTLLLVMLSIVLVSIVFFVIRGVVQSGTQSIVSSSSCLSSGVHVVSFSCLQDGSLCNVTIRRTSGSDTIGGTQLVFVNDNQDSNVSFVSGNIVALATEKATISNIGVVNITTIRASVYFNDASGKPVGCSISSETSGSIGTGITGTLGGSSGGSSGGESTGGVVLSCAPSDATLFGLCGNYECGQVANGTCSQQVACGSGCSSGEYCSNHYCLTVPTSCTPASQTVCADNGYDCGVVANGTCSGSINCGTSCPSGEYCLGNKCTPQSQCSPIIDSASYCVSHDYQCGIFDNGTCSGSINCSLSSNGGGCDYPSLCGSLTGYHCMVPSMLNNGTVLSAWPADSPRFFDSNDLPKSSVQDLELAVNASIVTGFNSYVRFPGSNENRCIEIALILYQASVDRSYVQLSLTDYANITSGDRYRIWNTYDGCITDTVT